MQDPWGLVEIPADAVPGKLLVHTKLVFLGERSVRVNLDIVHVYKRVDVLYLSADLLERATGTALPYSYFQSLLRDFD